MKKFLGTLLILLGLLGIIMPILPGWIFVLIGLTMIFPRLNLMKLR